MSKNPAPKPRKKKNLGGVIGLVVMLIVGFAAGFIGAETIDTMTGGDDQLFFINIFVMLGGLYLAFFLQIILHEGGHLFCGLLSGYKFVSFNVFGVIWQKGPDGKVHVHRMQVAGAGGQCLMAPPDYNGGDFPFTLYNLGGVLANLVTAAVFALLAWLIPVTWLRVLLLMEVVVGVAFALINGLPLPADAIQNDGKNLLCIRQDVHARRAFWVQMSIAAAQVRGLRLCDMPEDWFVPAPADKLDNPIICATCVFAAGRLMDLRDFAAAEEAIRALLAREKGVLGLYRTTLTCDGAFCELLAGRPGDLCDALSAKEHQAVLKAMKDNPSILRTQYALALLKDKDEAKAARILAQFDKAWAHFPYPQEKEPEKQLIALLQEAAK